MIETPVKKTLSIQMLIVMFVIVAFCIVAMGVLNYKGFKKEFRLNIENNLNAISNLKVAEIVQWRRERLADGLVFSENQNFSDLVSRFIASPANPDLLDRLGKWIKQVRSAYNYDRILLLDIRGNELISEPLQSKLAPSHLINDIDIIVKTQKVTFLDFHRDVPDGPIRLGVLVPVQSPGDPGKIIAVMVFVINPEVYLYPLINTWPTLSRTAETLLLRREGDSVLFLNELKFQKNTALNMRFSLNKTGLPAAMAASGNEGIFTGIDYRGVPVISSLHIIPDSPWFMVARMDVKEVYAPLSERWWTMFTVVVLLILSFASLMYTFAIEMSDREKKLQSIFSATPAGIGLVINRTYVEVNDTFCRMTGYSRNEIIGKSSAMMYPTIEEFEIVGVEKYEQIARKGIGSVETRLKCKDGRILNIISTSSPLNPKDLSKGVTFTVLDITERKQAETALRESEERFRTLYNDAVVGLYRTNSQGEILLANHALVKMLRFQSFDELAAINLNRSGVGTAYQRQKFIDQIEKEGEVKDLEVIWICRDGKEIFVRENAKAIYDSNGKIFYYDGTVEDITEQKKAAEALKKIQHLFETLALVSPVGIFRTDQDGYTTYVNPRYLNLTGLSLEEVMGGGWLNAVHPDDKEKLKENWLSDFKSHEIFNAEYRFIRPDGTIVWVMGNAVPEWIDNKIVGYIGTITDITESKQVEIVLRKSEEKYRMIFENVQDLYYEVMIDGTILEVSPSIEILSKGQYKMDDLIGKSMFDFYSEPKERQALLEALQERGAVRDFEITLKNSDGSKIPCSISAKIIFDVHGHPEKIIGSMHDITDRKNASEALKLAKEKAEASDKLKTTFLNNISHEVRTPMNGILGFAEIMSQPDLSEEEKKDSISMLHESSDRLLNTITNYMDISLITSGNMSVNKKDFIPGQVLRKIFDNYKTICSNRKLELLLKIPEQTDNILINSDPEIFQKIIAHLLSNAIKFTEKGSINFGYIIHEGEIEFFVKDTGIGIGKESVDNIFDRFVKEDHGPSRLSEGSGLGLSIAKGMVEIIGGNIRVESEIGVGSCFFFTIPLLQDNKAVLSGTSGYGI